MEGCRVAPTTRGKAEQPRFKKSNREWPLGAGYHHQEKLASVISCSSVPISTLHCVYSASHHFTQDSDSWERKCDWASPMPVSLTTPLTAQHLGEQLSQMGLRLLLRGGSRMSVGQEPTIPSVTIITREAVGWQKEQRTGRWTLWF